MGKAKNRKQNRESSTSGSNNKSGGTSNNAGTSSASSDRRSIYQWCLQESEGIRWVVTCSLLGGIFGFAIGTGLLTGGFYDEPPTPWRVAMGLKLRSSDTFQFLSHRLEATTAYISIIRGKNAHGNKNQRLPTNNLFPSAGYHNLNENNPTELLNNPSHPTVFAVLREAIVREKGGYVHPDLGILEPAPCGAARGIGMRRTVYHECQIDCVPGLAKEKRDYNATLAKGTRRELGQSLFHQEEVLIKVPLSFQMTRKVALDTLLPLISPEVQRKANLHELDDAALLVLLLAHERGVGQFSRYLPYIASLPIEPSCGYNIKLRPYLLDAINALRDESNLDVNGWSGELLKATQYADRISQGLAKDYGSFLKHPDGVSAVDNIQWALCQVASRGTAGSQKHGALRMIPMMDMVNHDESSGGFVELTGKERFAKGDFVDALEEDSGAFVVRSLRHGRRKALKQGQELLVNYNVPHYSPLDWFVSLGFVPPERWTKWQKMDAALPRVRRDIPIGGQDAAERSVRPAWQGAGHSSSDHQDL